MMYRLVGTIVPTVEFTLNKGESIYTQTGGMTWQTEGFKMSTNFQGGILKSLSRRIVGESLFMTTYNCNVDGAKIAFSTTVPGQIACLEMSDYPSGMLVQKGAFLCAEPSVELGIGITKKVSAGLFGGEGFILQKATGSGKMFLEVDGDKVEINLAEGEILKVDTGNVVAFEKTVSYLIEPVKGLDNIFFGREGVFLTKLVGPGKVIIQTQNIAYV